MSKFAQPKKHNLEQFFL